MPLEWARMSGFFEWDGSLRDSYVFGTSLPDWNRLLDGLRTCKWEEALMRSMRSLVAAVLHSMNVSQPYCAQAELEYHVTVSTDSAT